ncbi:phosphinothricin acetyltransferase [Chitinophaga dinghuensis]|uniref:Phosphinothricin acetyltransferase n=1 Tax=Chitinophaga dinghuensis TaxID=1539050 RepID=A0A327W236_9BACT|nr:GNAT family N-acetyltransferase [Chitinophaga dinghuensis]RAJ82356.1 phosphinothricin acetyltransferase [Chitinophaga dinghuensis]
MRLTYRHATIEDLDRIVAIYNTTIAGRMVTADTEPVTVESRLNWFHAHDADRRPLWMIEDAGINIGWMSFQSFYGRPAYNGTVEVSIYLDETARGKGYGGEILRYAISVSPNFKIDTLLGFIFAHNIPSLKLFEKIGFQEWAHLPDIALMDGARRSLKILGYKI